MALEDAIVETLSDYEVAEKIWSNCSNRTCADCRALNPDWASINLCVVICKNCAGTQVTGQRSQVRPLLTISVEHVCVCRPAQGSGDDGLQSAESETGHECLEQ